MVAIITEKFKLHNASQFVESFTEAAASTYYLFIGKPTAFSSTNDGYETGAVFAKLPNCPGLLNFTNILVTFWGPR